MIDWLKENKGTIFRISILVAMYALDRFFPGAGPERDLLASIALVAGVLSSALPGFSKVEK